MQANNNKLVNISQEHMPFSFLVVWGLFSPPSSWCSNMSGEIFMINISYLSLFHVQVPWFASIIVMLLRISSSACPHVCALVD